MGYICDFCGDQPSMVYCWSDAACLVYHVIELSILLMHCQNAIREHCYVKDAIPSLLLLDVLMKRFPSVRTVIGWVMMPLQRILHTRGETTCEQELGLMSISKNIESTSWGPTENTIRQNSAGVAEVNPDHNVDKVNGLVGTSIPKIRSLAQLLDQPAGSTDTSLAKVRDEHP
ncbi:B-box domain protein 7, CONSTANS-like 9 [Hibiscus trionum]|uniref:B-box domain protein 7, CONSTANS-like 9 n=1 Tax=Hibiscus trionum TaxID=183268 RepID=A0A9W7LMF6_HIBTR|nr:B-box domain protein 7, CONSTANS-like 9 [Hibiscus trionum]